MCGEYEQDIKALLLEIWAQRDNFTEPST